MTAVTLELPDDPEATARLGEWLGRHLQPGDTLGLVGDLGAGKTTLVRGLGFGLGLEDPEAVSSPTYLLVLEHPGPKPLLHADAYLPAKLQGFLEDGGLEYLLGGAAVVVVEWANNVRDLLPDNTLWLTLEVTGERGRRVELRPPASGGYAFVSDGPKILAEILDRN